MDEKQIAEAVVSQVTALIASTIDKIHGALKDKNAAEQFFPQGIQGIYVRVALGTPVEVEVEISALKAIHYPNKEPARFEGPPAGKHFGLDKPMVVLHKGGGAIKDPIYVSQSEGPKTALAEGESKEFDLAKGDVTITKS
jgi:hypothetical protein